MRSGRGMRKRRDKHALNQHPSAFEQSVRRSQGEYVRDINVALTQERRKELGKQVKEDIGKGNLNLSHDWRDVCLFFHPGLAPRRASAMTQIRYCGEHFALAMALLEDCLGLLINLKRGIPPPDYTQFSVKDDPQNVYKEAIYWLFYEVDPEGERVCSLDWCVNAINAATGIDLRADSMREQAARLGLLPKEYSR